MTSRVQLARPLFVGLVALLVGFTRTREAWGQDVPPDDILAKRDLELKVTHVSFLHMRTVGGGEAPTTFALPMVDHKTDLLIRLPEWVEGRAPEENEPAASRIAKPFDVYARFTGPADLEQAEI